MSMTSELKEATREIKLELAVEALDLIEEHISKVEMQATPSGHELIHGKGHEYLLREAVKQRRIIEKMKSAKA